MATVSQKVKGRILFDNGVPVGNASVEVFDADFVVALGRLPTQTISSLGFLSTNENGWFDGAFDMDVLDAPVLSIRVTLGGLAAAFQLNPGEPQLKTNWPGPKRYLRHEDPDIVARSARRAYRISSLPINRSTTLMGTHITFRKPLVRLQYVFSSHSTADLFALPLVTPSLPYMKEKAEGAEVFTTAAVGAWGDGTLKDGVRADYLKIFDRLPATSSLPQLPLAKPASIARMGAGNISDRYFAEQRLVGCNPMVISRVGSAASPNVPAGFAISDADARRIAGWTLSELQSVKRLYVCDYSVLHPVLRDHAKAFSAGIASVGLFHLTRLPPDLDPNQPRAVAPAGRVQRDRMTASRQAVIGTIGSIDIPLTKPDLPDRTMDLMPLAIMLIEQDGRRETVLPGQPKWEFAKLVLQTNDTLLHEMRFHLWNCHFAINPVVLTMIRQLDPMHPLYDLLNRHCYGVLWINNYGFEQLVNPGGQASTFLGLTDDGIAQALSDSQFAWSWNSTKINFDMDRRGLGSDALPNFPYRDDGTFLFSEIRKFTGEYVNIYYDNMNEVWRDEELQEWMKEMTALQLDGLPRFVRRDQGGGDDSKADLADFLAELIFQLSVFHGAVNSPQWDFIANSLDMPGYLRKLTGTQADASPDTNLMGRMPFIKDAIGMMKLMGQLAEFVFEPKGLGHYRDMWSLDRNSELPFEDPKAEEAAGRFRVAMDRVEGLLAQDDVNRKLKYPYLRPSMLDNSSHK
jgi:arachidonate 15-lipoxygenase